MRQDVEGQRKKLARTRRPNKLPKNVELTKSSCRFYASSSRGKGKERISVSRCRRRAPCRETPVPPSGYVLDGLSTASSCLDRPACQCQSNHKARQGGECTRASSRKDPMWADLYMKWRVEVRAWKLSASSISGRNRQGTLWQIKKLISHWVADRCLGRSVPFVLRR